jgi:hypothetical protein
MSFLDRHTIELLKHTVTNFVVAVAMCAAALGLDALERWCGHHEVTPWLVFGIRLMAQITFIIDAVVLIATIGMIGAHLISASFRRLFQ